MISLVLGHCLPFTFSTSSKRSKHICMSPKFIYQQSCPRRKTFQAKIMPFWKEKPSTLTRSLWIDSPSYQPFHCKLEGLSIHFKYMLWKEKPSKQPDDGKVVIRSTEFTSMSISTEFDS